MEESSPLWAPGSSPPPGLWLGQEPDPGRPLEAEGTAGPERRTDVWSGLTREPEGARGRGAVETRPAETGPGRWRRPSRGAVLVLVVVAAAVAAGAGVVAMDPGGAAPARHPTLKTYIPVPVTTSPTIAGAPAVAPAVAPYLGPIIRTPVPVNSGIPTNLTDPSVVATALVPSIPLYASPGAASPTSTLANPNYLGATVVLMVTGLQNGWVQAYVPTRPNDSTAWIPTSDLAISSVPCHIGIGIGAHRLVLYCHNAPVFEATVATGAPDSPTPTGSYFVSYIVKLTDPQDAYGPYALGTSAFSNTYFSFEGGPGQVGIHGTNQPWVIGGYASHGCVRLTNPDITALAQQVVPGTPVEIAP